MKPNHVIESKEDLLNHFNSSQKLEILDQEQMEKLLEMDVPPEVWEDASNRNLLSFSQEFVQQTKEFKFQRRGMQYCYILSFLTNLTDINLSANKISDISAVSKLKNLKKLDLSINFIDDIYALQSLTGLINLDLNRNKLTSYTVALPNLVELILYGNPLQDKSGLQHSPKLERLNLSKTETTDLQTISQLFGLKELYLSQNNITQISHLSNFVNLQKLHISQNKQLQNIEPLKFCTQLTELGISTTGVADIWSLQFMKNLITLQMVNTQVVDLHPLQHLYKLEDIFASYSCIIDVSPLSTLTQLNYLNFRNNKITNAETLEHHKNFSKYSVQGQNFPTPDELKFYNKRLSVHSSQKQIRKIQNENRASKFRESMTHRKEQFNLKINEQIQYMNRKIEIIFSHNSNADQ
ncbi:Conserved_hypothetical protein [Hexamita inflata]|uniref:Uncharacterized protein n=1 Tax=Hexamita inflata TaxID=28002 RepID=A0AA86NR84_9EUKA|nr:Conserved hypothetical protein [Hexamita inflata]